ncbi:MAG: phospholipid/cholesterol/gamma-HCH transport system substrate-binding protein [Solirubrobacteraceae bacterium]|nr:phospholipid/cholesterol/gamma-HCH transport system substrate-binding protein [Solirubrobacteraceae bacterium]
MIVRAWDGGGPSRQGRRGDLRQAHLGLRALAVGAVLAAAIVVVVTLLMGHESYRVHARFLNASQLVRGNLVEVAGQPAGKVESIRLGAGGLADVGLRIDDAYAPLRRGTQITVRQASLSGVANRYLDLRLGPHGAPAVPDGGTIGSDATTTAVDLDQLFDTFDARTRKALTGVLRGSAAQYRDSGRAYGEGLLYLNPSLSASSRVLRELNRDNPLLERFVVSSSKLVSDVAARRDDLAGLVDHLATTTTAIGDEQAALGDAIHTLPPFMRRANSTFVNLRAALDDLDPLVRDSKPAARRLRPFLAQLRPLARAARPTLNDLSALLRRKGLRNDLVELTRAQVPVANVAVGRVQANGKAREGALPASTSALRDAATEFGYARPYAPDLLGWFDDFSHTGTYDALGGVSRVGTHADAFMLVSGQLMPVPPQLRDAAFVASGGVRDQRNRCPGAAEHPAADGSGPYKPSPDYNCDPAQRLPGP